MQVTLHPTQAGQENRQLRLIDEAKWVHGMNKKGYPLLSYLCPHCGYMTHCIKPFRRVELNVVCIDCEQQYTRTTNSDGTINIQKEATPHE